MWGLLSWIARRRIAKLIVKCWKPDSLCRTKFIIGGIVQTDEKGNEYFYGAKEVDRAIKRMNRVLSRISSP